MKKIIASLVLAIIALFSFGCAKEMPYNVLYDAKFVDKSEKFMTEEFINELGDPCDFPEDRMLIIDNEIEFKRVYKSFPYEMDFEQDIIVIFMSVDIHYGFEFKLQDMYETGNELTIDIYHDIRNHYEDNSSAPTHRCSAVKLTNCNYHQTQIKIKR